MDEPVGEFADGNEVSEVDAFRGEVDAGCGAG
jgi:hypothetical protein